MCALASSRPDIREPGQPGKLDTNLNRGKNESWKYCPLPEPRLGAAAQ